jgi:hypothetical protein
MLSSAGQYQIGRGHIGFIGFRANAEGRSRASALLPAPLRRPGMTGRVGESANSS